MIIPDCTLTTACFNVSNHSNHLRNMDQIKKEITPLLTIPCYLVIYTDEHCIATIKEIRHSLKLSHLTQYIVTKIEDLPNYKYYDIIKSNREIYWPTKDDRAPRESHLLCCSKFHFVLNTINENPFQTKKFGWIDSFIRDNFSKICEDYTEDKILNILNNSPDNKFSIQVLGSVDKKFIKPENKREYYNTYRYLVCGCLFITNKQIGIKIMNRLNDLFVSTTLQGYGHGEEMLYLEVLDEFYHDIHKSYGDYGQILNNFIHPTRNYSYIYKSIIYYNLYYYGNYRESYDCAKELQYGIEELGYKVDADIYMDILIARYKSSLVINPAESIHRITDIYDACKKDESMQTIFMTNREHYVGLFKECPLFVE